MLEAFIHHLPSLSVFSILAMVAFMGGVMRGFSGFGSGLLMAPIYGLMMSPTDVVVIILMLNFITILPLLGEALRNVQWPLVWRIFIPSMLGAPLGLALLHLIDPLIMRKTVACVVSLTAIIMLAGWVYKGRRGYLQDGVAGVLSGFMTATGGIGGPPLALYLLTDPNLRAAAFRAFCLIFFLFAQIFTLTPLALTGAINVTQISLCLALLPLYVVSNAVGAYLHKRHAHNEARVRRICLLFLLAVGLIAFVL